MKARKRIPETLMFREVKIIFSKNDDLSELNAALQRLDERHCKLYPRDETFPVALRTSLKV